MQFQNFSFNSGGKLSPAQSWAPEPECAAIWPSEYLRDFAERMAINGMSVSGVRLRNDPIYTLKQLATAHAADDETLRDMAMALFRYLESRQSGIPPSLVG